MSPISLFKAGVMFGLTIYTIAKKGFMDDKMRAYRVSRIRDL
jgi:hypothetical protein